MDVMQACRCCLRCPPDKDLTTPYTHLGGTEIYADMLKQCFDIQLLVGDDVSRGICSACVGRLRDASDFKLQVQRSQAELQARLGVCLLTKEEPTVKTELQDGDGASEEPVLSEEPPVKTELLDEDRTPDDMLFAEPLIKTEIADEDETSRDMLFRARQQLEMNSALRLEHLRGDEGHTSTHSGQEPYTCEHCGKQFRKESNLKKHEEKTHSSTAPKIFACNFCSSKFQTKLLVLDHEENAHGVTIFMCSKCGYTTHEKNSLLTHSLAHSRCFNKNNHFKCSQCSYTTRYKSNLRRHEFVHTGDKRFECSYCHKRFDYNCYLQKHKIRHPRGVCINYVS